MSGYRDYEAKAGPAWLQGPNGAAFMAELGGIKDDVIERIRQAVQVAFPDYAPGVPPTALQSQLGTDSALDHIGADRGLPRGPSESPSDWDPTVAASNGQGAHDQAYAARLKAAPTTWVYAGSAYGLLTALAAAGIGNAYPNSPVIVTHNGRWYQLNGATLQINGASGTTPLMPCLSRSSKTGTTGSFFPNNNGWTFDFRDQMWTQFGIVFPNDLSALYGADSAGAALRASLAQIVETWKPAKSVYRGAWVVVTGIAYGWPVTTTWGQASLNWGGNTIKFMAPSGAVVTT